MHGLAISVSLVGLAMLVWSSPAAPQSEIGLRDTAEAICTAPPFDNRARSLVRRLHGYDRVLEQIADRCPDVAMIFAQFATGAVSLALSHPQLDYLWQLDFPQPRAQAEIQ